MKKSVFTVLLLSSILFANDYNKGVDAYKSGDFETALLLWRPYAETGNSSAQYSIATIFYEGKGVEQDYQNALYWYRKAAEQKHAKSLLRIALMYCRGEGVLKSFKDAVPYVRSAYENGCDKAPEVWNRYQLWIYE